MYRKIAMPFDLAHVEHQHKALATGADLARHYGAELVLVGVTSSQPSSAARDPEDHAERLARFAAEQSAELGATIGSHSVISHDPSVDLEKQLDKAIHALGADLIVVASHAPGLLDLLFRSHGGTLATHTDLSVLIVR